MGFDDVVLNPVEGVCVLFQLSRTASNAALRNPILYLCSGFQVPGIPNKVHFTSSGHPIIRILELFLIIMGLFTAAAQYSDKSPT